MLRQRQLHEDAVDLRIGIEFGDLRQHHVLRDVGRIDDLLGMELAFSQPATLLRT